MPDAKDLKGKTGLKRLANAFLYSKDGFAAAYRSEEAFRQEFWLLVVGAVIAILLPVSLMQTVALIAVLLFLLIVEILNSVDRGTEKHIMETLEVEEPELADEIRKKMFVFEDILSLDNRAIQRVLRDVDNHDLALALKGATEEVQNVILNNLSTRLASMIKEDMEYMGPVRMKDVEDAQQKIVNIIRKLEDSAEIVISRGGGDEIIV